MVVSQEVGGHEGCVTGAELLVLFCVVERLAEGSADSVALVSDHNDGTLRPGFLDCVDDQLHHGHAGDFVKSFGQVAFHPGPLASSENQASEGRSGHGRGEVTRLMLRPRNGRDRCRETGTFGAS